MVVAWRNRGELLLLLEQVMMLLLLLQDEEECVGVSGEARRRGDGCT